MPLTRCFWRSASWLTQAGHPLSVRRGTCVYRWARPAPAGPHPRPSCHRSLGHLGGREANVNKIGVVGWGRRPAASSHGHCQSRPSGSVLLEVILALESGETFCLLIYCTNNIKLGLDFFLKQNSATIPAHYTFHQKLSFLHRHPFRFFFQSLSIIKTIFA